MCNDQTNPVPQDKDESFKDAINAFCQTYLPCTKEEANTHMGMEEILTILCSLVANENAFYGQQVLTELKRKGYTFALAAGNTFEWNFKTA